MKKLIYILMGLLFTVACDNLVDVDYPSDQVSSEQVFESVQTANAALSGLYAELRDGSVITGAGYYSAGTLLGSYTDDLDCYTNDQNGVLDIYQNQQQEGNTIVSSIWCTAYTHIYYANTIISGAGKSEALTEKDKNQIIGEAMLLRSLIYFYLQQLFGDIPYTTSTDYELNRSLARTNSDALLANLEADLTEAIDMLKNGYRNSERIYPNRKVAQLLLARIYLLRGSYTEAQRMADSILTSPLYQFQNDINEVFHKNSTHILWQLHPENSGYATDEASFYYFSDSEPYAYALTPDLMNSFDAGDLRRQSWIQEVIYNGRSWYRSYKYKNLAGINDNEYSIVFRLEEVYFIKAEALAKQSLFDDALPYLNATRERAGLTPLASLSGDDFFSELLAEKRREFFCESGLRFLDLKRLGRIDVLSALKPNWEAYKEVWPLPQSEMLMNNNLAPQNNGY